MASASGTLKRVTLELGGNDPAILLDDADFDAMTPKIFGAAFANCGQVCMAIKRLYVPAERYEQVCDSLANLAKNYRVGDGFEADVQMGPLQNKMQYDKVLDVLEDTKRQPGVRILAGGHTLNQPGYFLAPTIVADISMTRVSSPRNNSVRSSRCSSTPTSMTPSAAPTTRAWGFAPQSGPKTSRRGQPSRRGSKPEPSGSTIIWDPSPTFRSAGSRNPASAASTV
jgi:hypothetical protein